ncbi:MAG: hypothetical protein JWQ89_3483 [Devosia sp.]|nr:hypothetical protein [Devosia sp.]MDB5541756.1 hypothetical protein [Devosia sp.]
MQCYATPDGIAPIALLLASDASSFMTGSVVVRWRVHPLVAS